jgi:hypothetical protein
MTQSAAIASCRGSVTSCSFEALSGAHGSDAAAVGDVKRSAIGELIRPAVFRRALRATTVRQALDQKSRTDQHICARWSGLDLASLNHTRPAALSARDRRRTRLDVSEQRYRVSPKATSFSCRSSSSPSSPSSLS